MADIPLVSSVVVAINGRRIVTATDCRLSVSGRSIEIDLALPARGPEIDIAALGDGPCHIECRIGATAAAYSFLDADLIDERVSVSNYEGNVTLTLAFCAMTVERRYATQGAE